MTKQRYSTIRGMSDILPPETGLWDCVERAARDTFSSFGCLEIRTPLVEKTELFVRSIGDSTSIVEKEMYTFKDRDGELLSLRPEATASVVRAYIQGSEDKLAKYYYMGPMFRYERPQKGRKRQFSQIGVEVIGASDPAVDAEVMSMCYLLFKKIGLTDFILEINSIGCSACRPQYHEKFLKFLKEKSGGLCEDCLRRIEKNPLRAFDCKNEDCKKAMETAPIIGDHLCGECSEHFSGVQKYLKVLDIPFEVNHRIVRGLDYYVRTAFEFTTDKLGSQNAISAGGRYDGLVASMGGNDAPGVGFSIGVERVIMLMESLGIIPDFEKDLIFFALLGDRAKEKLLPTIKELRSKGVNCEWDYEGRSLKAQMRLANRLKAKKVIIVGDQEVESGKVIVKDMTSGEQKEVEIDEISRKI